MLSNLAGRGVAPVYKIAVGQAIVGFLEHRQQVGLDIIQASKKITYNQWTTLKVWVEVANPSATCVGSRALSHVCHLNILLATSFTVFAIVLVSYFFQASI